MTVASAPTPRPTDWNAGIIADLRAHKGKTTAEPFVNSDLLILTTTGAKSGVERTTPVVYTRDGDDYVIVASKGGAPTNPAWYANLVAHPQVELEINGERFKARAHVASPESERRRLYDAHAARYAGFREYEQKTDRIIPVVVLSREPSL